MKNKLKERGFQKGFTLIELVLYMGIFSILISVLSAMFGAIVETQLESQSTSSVDQDGRYVLSRLLYDMHNADSIDVPANPGDVTSSLTIEVNSVDYIYSLDASGSGNLRLVNNLGTNVLNSSDTQVSGLEFERIGSGDSNDTVRVRYTITSKTQRPSGPETQSFQTTLSLQ